MTNPKKKILTALEKLGASEVGEVADEVDNRFLGGSNPEGSGDREPKKPVNPTLTGKVPQ